MKYILLIDGAFLKIKFYQYAGKEPTAADIETFSKKIANHNESTDELIRIYYYDSPPLTDKLKKPISGTILNLATTPAYLPNKARLDGLKRIDYFAVREGRLSCHGWKLRKKAIGIPQASLADDSFVPDIQQKGVDMKIGLDIAWISFQKIAQRILVVTGDSDFIPAVKLARRNGIQVFLFTLDHGVNDELKDHADKLITKSVCEIMSLP